MKDEDKVGWYWMPISIIIGSIAAGTLGEVWIYFTLAIFFIFIISLFAWLHNERREKS